MSEKFSVSMESPQSGWMSLRLRAAGGRQFVAVMSHAPYDSLRELIEGLTALAGGAGGATVRWNAEPEEYDFELKAEGDSASLRVVRYAGHRRAPAGARTAFSCRGSRAEMCLPFWRELTEMRARSETDVFEQNWRRAFPLRELRKLTKALKAHAPGIEMRASEKQYRER